MDMDTYGGMVTCMLSGVQSVAVAQETTETTQVQHADWGYECTRLSSGHRAQTPPSFTQHCPHHTLGRGSQSSKCLQTVGRGLS